jgi:branched-chain amino acid transport system permease protein
VSAGRRLLAGARGALATSAAAAALLFPLVAVRIDAVERTVDWRWARLGWAAGAVFALARAGRLLRQPAAAAPTGASCSRAGSRASAAARALAARPAARRGGAAALLALALLLPLASSTYQVNVLTAALIAVILGLGLNIIVGLAGMLNLGYAAFTAVGAYGYALLNLHLGVGFWAALPVAGLLAAAFGLALGFPVLRLRGDYLAIVTLGFGEIARLVLENWSAATNGPGGIANIPRPGLFGAELGQRGATLLLYFVALALAAGAAAAVARLKDSRVGRAWVALREDEVAAEAMGIDRTRTKLAALALGAFFAGVAGVLFAARTTFVNPASFTFLESAMVLAAVVLGGPGSVGGVVVASLVLVLLPEYLRPFAQYRMPVFGAALVLLMILRARRGGARALAGGSAP